MMDIDDTPPSTPETLAQLHPLAIFAISDHFTRTRLGGSPLPTNARVIGLLFGTYSYLTPDAGRNRSNSNASDHVTDTHTNKRTQTAVHVHVMDAEDVAVSQDLDMIRTKMELHRAVYPNQRVVGWYKVTDDKEQEQENVTEWDLTWHRQTVQLCLMEQEEKEQKMNVSVSPVVLFMRQQEAEDNTYNMDPTSAIKEEDILPLSMYQLQESSVNNNHDSGVAFVDVKFELNSKETERISMEHLFKSQTTKKTSGVLAQMESSIDQLNSRISVLLQYLHAVQKSELPPNFELLRRINGLLHQISATNQYLDEDILRQSSNSYIDSSILCQLATLTKTIQSLQGLTEKSSLVTNLNIADANSTASSNTASATREREIFMMRSRGTSSWA